MVVDHQKQVENSFQGHLTLGRRDKDYFLDGKIAISKRGDGDDNKKRYMMIYTYIISPYSDLFTSPVERSQRHHQ